MLPLWKSEISMSFVYSELNLDELKKAMEVSPGEGWYHASSGALYFPFQSKETKLDSEVILPGEFSIGVQIPCTLFHPLLNPGSTRFISSPYSGPFSVSHNFPVKGSKAIPKPLRIPYAKYLSNGSSFPIMPDPTASPSAVILNIPALPSG